MCYVQMQRERRLCSWREAWREVEEYRAANTVRPLYKVSGEASEVGGEIFAHLHCLSLLHLHRALNKVESGHIMERRVENTICSQAQRA